MRFRRLRIAVLLALGGTALMLTVPWIALRISTSGAVVSVADAPKAKVALVLGAGLRPNGTASAVLDARVRAAIALYKRGAVQKLVMSGDNSRTSYDEVSVMKQVAVAAGVKPNDVLLDYAGFRTLDSCVRIRRVFGQREILVVSQRFHLARAIHLCRWAGLRVHGVIADDPRGSGGRRKSTIREFPASTAAWIDAHVFGTEAKFTGPAINVDDPPADALTQPL